MDFKKINLSTLKKYTSPQAIKEFDIFLDSLPANVGQNLLIMVGIVWIVALGAVFFTLEQTDNVNKMHTELMQVEALQPPIPVLKYIPVNQDRLRILGDKLTASYKGINILAGTGGEITVSSQDTDYFPQFISTIGYIQRGSKNWKVNVISLCVGRDCKSAKLMAKLKVETVRIGEPENKG